MAYLLRRRKLGRTSCRELARYSRTGILAIRNDKAIPSGDQMCFRWGCTSNIPENHRVINSSEAIHRVTDKVGFRRTMDEKDLCPETWEDIGELRYPCVIRPAHHHQGRHLFVCRNRDEARLAIDSPRCRSLGWYASPLVNKTSEYRVFCVSGRAVCVAKKYPANPQDVAWNVARGGRFENVRWESWPLKAVRIALEAFSLSGLDFGGVDIMIGSDASVSSSEEDVYVLEINAAPSLTSPYRQQCFSKAFDYIVQHGKAPIPIQKEKGNYKKFIHPAILEDFGLANP